MKFSIINVATKQGNRVNGLWLKNHIGTLESAKKEAREINKINSNRLDIAIVEEVSNTNPMLAYFNSLERLD